MSDMIEKIKRKIKDFLLKFGIRMLSEREYRELRLQRNSAIKKMTGEFNKIDFITGLSSVIFSKDRAMQLHLLLESFDKAVNCEVSIFVLYKASNRSHLESYEELISLSRYDNLNVHFVGELYDFKEDLLNILKKIETDKLFFLTDDDVFIREWDTNAVLDIDASESILSLRHGLNIVYSYNKNRSISQPKTTLAGKNIKIYKFDWLKGLGEWSDPLSVDGHIYSTAEILNISLISDFEAPNTYEAALKTYYDIFPQSGLCYSESIIVNLPINIVQDEVKNKSGDVSVDYLLDHWIKGYKIDLSDLSNVSNSSTHEERKIKFILR
jgi:hypothetical protein